MALGPRKRFWHFNSLSGWHIIMKSGKIKIKMGDIYFDINEGSLTKFAQYSAVVTGITFVFKPYCL